MKTVVCLLFIATISAAGFWYITENEREDRKLAYQRQQELQRKLEEQERERAEMQKAEDERLRKEHAEATAKENAVRMFLAYIDREENRLKDEIEEAEINIQKLDIDRDSLSAELQAIESANAARVASATKRNEMHRDKIERVRAFLSSPVLNRLAKTYCGEDLTALQAEFEAEVQKIKDVDDKYQKKMRSNLSKYDETVKGADEKVNKRLKAARDKYKSVQKNMDPDRLKKLQAELADVERRIERILGKKMQSNWDKRDLERLQNQQILLQNQISNYTDVTGLASANILHMDATEAETEARRTYDRAGKTLSIDNSMALLERDHEQDVYNMAKRYEDKSLGRIRESIKLTSMWICEKMAQAKKHLSFLKQKAVNLDILNAEEIEKLRKEIANSTMKSLIEVEDGK